MRLREGDGSEQLIARLGGSIAPPEIMTVRLDILAGTLGSSGLIVALADTYLP
jgi:hypothetical protein